MKGAASCTLCVQVLHGGERNTWPQQEAQMGTESFSCPSIMRPAEHRESAVAIGSFDILVPNGGGEGVFRSP